MKALVFSDSHGLTMNMERVLSTTGAHMDAVLHLGDGFFDVIHLERQYSTNTAFYQVVGNCDPYDLLLSEPTFKLITLGGKRVLMTHGHFYGVRTSIHKLSLLAEEQQADICLFGHTHVPYLLDSGGLLIMNPGSISRPRTSSHPSYGVIEITPSGGVHGSVVEMRPEGYHTIL